MHFSGGDPDILKTYFTEALSSPIIQYMLCSSAIRLACSEGLHRRLDFFSSRYCAILVRLARFSSAIGRRLKSGQPFGKHLTK